MPALPLLAKSDPPETLDDHTLQVWECFWAFWRRHGGAACSLLEEALAVAAFVHDLGKAHPHFQRRLTRQTTWPHRHELISLLALLWFFPLEDERTLWAAAAVITHHRDWPEIAEQYPPTDPHNWEPPDYPLFSPLWKNFSFKSEQGQALLRQAGASLASFRPMEAVAQWVEKSFPAAWEAKAGRPFWGWHCRPTCCPAIKDPRHAKEKEQVARLLHRLAQEPLNPVRKLDFLRSRGFLLLADRLGSAKGTVQTLPPKSTFEGRILRSDFCLYPHQRRAAETAGNLLLIAPTGSGKTEAALFWAIQALQENPQGVLYYLLPYQANLNAMWERLAQRYGFRPGQDLALWHSRSLLVLHETFQNQAPSQSYRAYNHGRLLSPALFLSTPYQLLRAIYGLPGHEMLRVSFVGSQLIVDEVHSYDPYRVGLLLGLLRTASEEGSRLCLMTATLPTWLEEVIDEALPGLNKVRASPETYQSFQRHSVHLREGGLLDEVLAQEALAHAQGGEKVLLVVNTVKTAQALYEKLRSHAERGVDVLLLHGRYIFRDRLAKEKQLAVREQAPEGLLCVATQVVEVSLDVSFDRLYTELAPLEALIQRFGRVNRRRHAPTQPVIVCKEPTSWHYPYRKKDLLERVLAVLEQLHNQPFPEDKVDALLEESYGPLAEEYRQKALQGYKDARRQLEHLPALSSASQALKEEYEALFDGVVCVPEAVWEEFVEAEQQSSWQAQLFTLTLPLPRLAYLKRQGKAFFDPSYKVYKLCLPYNAEVGLTYGEVEEGSTEYLILD